MRDILSSVIKWFFDKLIAILGILFLFFPFLITIAAIKIDSPGVAVFKQARVGKNMKVFYVYKFRTLRSIDVPFDVDNPIIPYDSKQVTRVGRFLRRYKVDEFLELLNVLKGDMSLIGPRPLMKAYMPCYEEWEKKKFDVRPGITGLAQVNGNSHLTREERSYFDVKYVEERNLFMDIKIFFRTIGVMLLGEEKYLPKDREYISKRIDAFKNR